VYHLAWIWDLNTQKARQIFAKERLPEKIILYLQEKVNPEPLVIEKLKKYVLSWYVEFNLGEPDYTGK